MNFIGKGIAFASLVAGATWLELSGKESGGLWFVIVMWVLFGTWNDKKGDDDGNS